MFNIIKEKCCKTSKRKKTKILIGAVIGPLFFIFFFTFFFERQQKIYTSIIDPLVQQKEALSLPLDKKNPLAMEYFSDVLSHPWVLEQNEVKELSYAMVEDVNNITSWYNHLYQEAQQKNIPIASEREVLRLLTQSLKNLQGTLPFQFPPSYYNVISLEKSDHESFNTLPPFEIYQRIYMDQTELGFPFYLEVKVFSLEDENDSKETILWHLGLLEPNSFESYTTSQGVAYLGKGWKNSAKDLSHGFANLQGERGVFLYFIQKDKILYLAVADGPWNTFEKHIKFFKNLLY